MTAQIPASIATPFSGTYFVFTTTKQEQVSGGAYVMEGSSPTTIAQDRSMYWMAC